MLGIFDIVRLCALDCLHVLCNLDTNPISHYCRWSLPMQHCSSSTSVKVRIPHLVYPQAKQLLSARQGQQCPRILTPVARAMQALPFVRWSGETNGRHYKGAIWLHPFAFVFCHPNSFVYPCRSHGPHPKLRKSPWVQRTFCAHGQSLPGYLYATYLQ